MTMNGGAAGSEMTPEGGVAGMPPMITLGEQCSTCAAATACADTMTACDGSADCKAWLGCLSACDTGECVAACDATHAVAARLYSDVYDCLCTSCKDDCSGAGACEKKTCVDDNPLPISDTAPGTLAETGLYETIGGIGAGGAGGAGGGSSVDLAMPIKVAGNIQTYEPKYPLWADGATKQRYVYIPKCSTIDTSDMDHWKFPIGTRFWKQFSVGQTRVETRLMHRFGPGEADWLFATYQWDVADQTDPAAATLVDALGVPNANGTTHDIPPTGACTNCHGKLTERVLSFGAFQLSHAATGKDLAIAEISDLGWLTMSAHDGFDVPGTAVQQAALGYLHGNCGGCHNQGQSIPNAQNPLFLRLLVGQKTYAATDAVKTTVGVIVSSGQAAITGKPRIAPMSPDTSAILLRMKDRGTSLQMPPVSTDSTKDPDTNGGVKVVTDWVNSIPLP
jgi:hypothetical protein